MQLCRLASKIPPTVVQLRPLTRRKGSVALVPRPPAHVSCASYGPQQPLDAELAEAVEEVCERTRTVIAEAEPRAIDALHEELTSTWELLMEEKDLDAAHFIAVLQGLLQQTIVDSVADLKGPYLRAYKQLYNALQRLNWELRPERPPEEGPRQTAASGGTDYYGILGVESSASREEIRGAYRKLALKWHPDVRQKDDAEMIFIKIQKAYDVLSDGTSRKLYDRYGAEGMETKAGAHAGDGNADRFWDEFKPFNKESRKTKARTASKHWLRERSNHAEGQELEPATGDVVEYPLSDLIKAEMRDGREKGVGLLVGRNKDRGDAAKLPPELLGMCEIEPLRQEHAHSNRWIPDEIGCSAFCELDTLLKVPVTSYDGRFDVWVIDAELSADCGGPEIVEEIVL